MSNNIGITEENYEITIACAPMRAKLTQQMTKIDATNPDTEKTRYTETIKMVYPYDRFKSYTVSQFSETSQRYEPRAYYETEDSIYAALELFNKLAVK